MIAVPNKVKNILKLTNPLKIQIKVMCSFKYLIKLKQSSPRKYLGYKSLKGNSINTF